MGLPDAEILEILGAHAGQRVDYVALFMFLNTVAGGHYEERYTEPEIWQSLRQLVEQGQVEVWEGETKLNPDPAALPQSATAWYFRLGTGVSQA